MLLLSGFLFAQHPNKISEINKYVIIFLSFLALLGCYYFMQNQLLMALQGSNSGRISSEDGNASINAVGVAYVNANLFFILFSLQKLTYVKTKWVKFSLFLGLLSCIVIIVSTGSRGAILFTILILFINSISKIKSVINAFDC